MRTPFRLITSTVLGAVLLLGIGVGSTFAAGSQVVKYDLTDAWCFQDVVERYCTEQKGTFTIVTKADGSEVGKVDMTVKVDVTADGAFVATYTTKARQELRSNADGSYSFTSHDRIRWTDGETTCKTDIRLKIVDFEVIVDSITSNCL